MNPLFSIIRFLPAAVMALIPEVHAMPPPGHPSTDDLLNLMKVPEVIDLPHQGTVLQSIDSNSYTYIQVKLEQQTIWLAAPRIKLTEGQQIAFPNGTLMRNFYSRKLKRTFEGVIFVRMVEILPERT